MTKFILKLRRGLRVSSILWMVSPAVLAAGANQPTASPSPPSATQAAPLDWVRIGPDHRSFSLQDSGAPFVPWGFNYDHDESGRLLEDYWEKEWPKVEADFGEMKALGANVVRVHLQFGKFMNSSREANGRALSQLSRLLRLAERLRLRLDLTGLGCYHRPDVPKWYDELSDARRWDAQAAFWSAIARTCSDSPAVFCYDLMNEPVAPAGKGKRTDWLGPPFAGKYFVQWIALETHGRDRTATARAWIQHLTAAIRAVDTRHLVTVGLVPWSLDRPGLFSGFAPDRIAPDLDFISVHLYPETGKLREALDILSGFAVGKPVVIEETFPLRASRKDFARFIRESRRDATGWIGFYWGKTPEECKSSGRLADVLMLSWLEFFQKNQPAHATESRSPDNAVPEEK